MITAIITQFEKLQHGDCWTGLNFEDVLHNVDHTHAVRKPPRGGNSIWQLVNHLVYWRTVTIIRLSGSLDEPGFEDFSLPENTDKTAWRKSQADFEQVYHQLCKAILDFDIRQLHTPSPRPEQTYYDLLTGCLQHDTYHQGQIVLLKKWLIK